ncbi:hypothetical protein TYRP_016099 [Tyrophagus putrescentiae]|nr:hypothetical protein TYRP_016099 [Tyrophagus putrescentiae]
MILWYTLVCLATWICTVIRSKLFSRCGLPLLRLNDLLSLLLPFLLSNGVIVTQAPPAHSFSFTVVELTTLAIGISALAQSIVVRIVFNWFNRCAFCRVVMH